MIGLSGVFSFPQGFPPYASAGRGRVVAAARRDAPAAGRKAVSSP
ncbi:hypothetical protein [Streptomyces sp. NPDC126503]